LDPGKHLFSFVPTQLAFQYDADRPLESTRQIDFGPGQARQRQAGEFLGEQINRIVAEYVHGCPSRQQADEVKRKFLLNLVKVAEKPFPVDLLNVHGGSLAY